MVPAMPGNSARVSARISDRPPSRLVDPERQRIRREAMTPGQNQLRWRHRVDHTKAGQRRACGERSRAGGCGWITAHGPCVRCGASSRERLVQPDQRTPRVIDAGGDDHRVLVHEGQLFDRHQLRPAQRNCGSTSVPISSMVRITASWGIL